MKTAVLSQEIAAKASWAAFVIDLPVSSATKLRVEPPVV
jgi:hypothetical protein